MVINDEKFVSVCIAGACPEVKRSANDIQLRNPKQPEVVVTFSSEDWRELKDAFKEDRI